jgi:hypothetical protein
VGGRGRRPACGGSELISVSTTYASANYGTWTYGLPGRRRVRRASRLERMVALDVSPALSSDIEDLLGRFLAATASAAALRTQRG